MNKSAIRKIYQQKRLSLTPKQAETNSTIISNNFIINLLPKITNFSNKKLAFYIAINNEVNPITIIKHCQALGNIISLPKIIPNNLILNFKEYKIGDQLNHNTTYQKLLEPEEQKNNIIPDIIFTPLVSFNKNCNRIGMGRGFYDATINYLRKNKKQIFIGLGYSWQNCSEFHQEEWDRSLDFIISEKNIISNFLI